MFTNVHTITVNGDDGSAVTLALRLPIGSQLQLKKKYNESTRDIIFHAGNDDDKFIDVLTNSLNWKGNTNAIKDGVELLERLIDAGDMGMIARQRIMLEIGRVSGIFSDKEATSVATRIDRMEDRMINGGIDEDDDEDEDEIKNV